MNEIKHEIGAREPPCRGSNRGQRPYQRLDRTLLGVQERKDDEQAHRVEEQLPPELEQPPYVDILAFTGNKKISGDEDEDVDADLPAHQDQTPPKTWDSDRRAIPIKATMHRKVMKDDYKH